jgi:ATP-dependent Clp protease ATP-binding subunit ClpX
MIRILTEPRNALTKQYIKLMDMEDVELTFEEDAIEAIAEKAIARKIGARGLRSILEDVMCDIMYNVPSQPEVQGVIITAEAVSGDKPATLVYAEDVADRRGA